MTPRAVWWGEATCDATIGMVGRAHTAEEEGEDPGVTDPLGKGIGEVGGSDRKGDLNVTRVVVECAVAQEEREAERGGDADRGGAARVGEEGAK